MNNNDRLSGALELAKKKEVKTHKPRKLSKKDAKKAYKDTKEQLGELCERTFIELSIFEDWHLRLIALNGNTLDIYPKTSRYCMVKEEGVVNNRWGFYQELIPFVEDFFGV